MKIMVVEDYQDTRELMKLMLEMKGCQVIEAVDGKQAVDLARRDGLDLILMDLNLPVLDGYAATKQILAYLPTQHIPIVAFSAQCREERRQRALDAGCVDCIQKPIDMSKLDDLLTRFSPHAR